MTTEPTIPSSDFLPISYISVLPQGYRCDGSSGCGSWARIRIDYRDDREVMTRRYCDIHAAWRLGVRP